MTSPVAMSDSVRPPETSASSARSSSDSCRSSRVRREPRVEARLGVATPVATCCSSLSQVDRRFPVQWCGLIQVGLGDADGVDDDEVGLGRGVRDDLLGSARICRSTSRPIRPPNATPAREPPLLLWRTEHHRPASVLDLGV